MTNSDNKRNSDKQEQLRSLHKELMVFRAELGEAEKKLAELSARFRQLWLESDEKQGG